ncbi:MAG: outer membrane protein assembly factor BamD [Verrucomicrobiota bacterium]|nr:outer membrane protein assembly factor BamD [Verrucomicrobiota bacterium]
MIKPLLPFFVATALFAAEGPSVLEYTHVLQEALENHEWSRAVGYAKEISTSYGKSPFAAEIPYILGEAYFHLEEWDKANESLSDYLTKAASPKHFEDALNYRFQIAEKFREGAKKPLFGVSWLPRLLSGEEDALSIYEDLITSMPHEQIAAQALLGKAEIQARWEEYKPSLETLDLLIRRFPKHDLAAEAFLQKGHIYAAQLQERNDPALLDLAEMNLKKFRLAFPREGRVEWVEKEFKEMRESFAGYLMETAAFFEKTKKIPASILYYSKIVSQYPETESSGIAKERLDRLQDKNPSKA